MGSKSVLAILTREFTTMWEQLRSIRPRRSVELCSKEYSRKLRLLAFKIAFRPARLINIKNLKIN